MEETTFKPTPERASGTNYLLLLIVSLVLIGGGVIAYQSLTAQQSQAALTGAVSLSQAELEARHGLQIRLIGVTGGGGMIDFRLKMIDPQAARLFLEDPANLPIIMIAEDGTQLLAADELEDEIAWEEGGILFMLLSNSDGVVQPGSAVTLRFGDIQLEPVPAQ